MMWNLFLPCGKPLLRQFDRHFSVCALATCSVLGALWFLSSWGSRDGHDAAGVANNNLQSIYDKRLVVFGDSWSDPGAGEVRVWTEWLCSSVRFYYNYILCRGANGLADRSTF